MRHADLPGAWAFPCCHYGSCPCLQLWLAFVSPGTFFLVHLLSGMCLPFSAPLWEGVWTIEEFLTDFQPLFLFFSPTLHPDLQRCLVTQFLGFSGFPWHCLPLCLLRPPCVFSAYSSRLWDITLPASRVHGHFPLLSCLFFAPWVSTFFFFNYFIILLEFWELV